MNYEYGAMSSRFALEAPDHKTAIAAMLLHYGQSNHLIVVYEPADVPPWFDFSGKISARLHEIFGEDVEKFIDTHADEVKAAYTSIKRLV